jgi:hypothetical protein
MDFLQNATDDQIALMGCFVALATSAALMYISVFLSRTHRREQVRETMSRTLSLASRDERSGSTIDASSRKVA